MNRINNGMLSFLFVLLALFFPGCAKQRSAPVKPNLMVVRLAVLPQRPKPKLWVLLPVEVKQEDFFVKGRPQLFHGQACPRLASAVEPVLWRLAGPREFVLGFEEYVRIKKSFLDGKSESKESELPWATAFLGSNAEREILFVRVRIWFSVQEEGEDKSRVHSADSLWISHCIYRIQLGFYGVKKGTELGNELWQGEIQGILKREVSPSQFDNGKMTKDRWQELLSQKLPTLLAPWFESTTFSLGGVLPGGDEQGRALLLGGAYQKAKEKLFGLVGKGEGTAQVQASNHYYLGVLHEIAGADREALKQYMQAARLNRQEHFVSSIHRLRKRLENHRLE